MSRGLRTRKRLLLVEQDGPLARDLARALVVSGYSVRIARTLAQAEAASRDEPYDCGVFDVALGPHEGWRLARQLIDRKRVRAAVFFSMAALEPDSDGQLAREGSDQLENLRFMVALACS